MEAERNITRRDINRRNRNRNNRNRNNRNNDRMSRLSRRVGDNILSAANFASAIPRRSIRQVGEIFILLQLFLEGLVEVYVKDYLN